MSRDRCCVWMAVWRCEIVYEYKSIRGGGAGKGDEMLKLAVTGAAGRMGRRIIALAQEAGDIQITAALEAEGHPLLGSDAGEVAGVGMLGTLITELPQEKPEVMIDFTVPASTEKWIEYCHDNKIPMVVGTTGLTEAQKQQIQKASEQVAMLWAANMSLGVNLLLKVVAEVAQKLPEDFDIEIIEAHHRFKRDAPSGTALELARQIAGAKNWPWPGCLVHGRQGGETMREKETIGMHAVRGGDVVGQHSVMFSAQGETVELRHQAHSRDTFVRGALHGGRWLKGRGPGMYSMFDVLDL